MVNTWFLFPGPDFTFKPDGPLRLGTIIQHPKYPTKTLLQTASQTNPVITLPSISTVTETNHNHSRTTTKSFGTKLLMRFLEIVSASLDTAYETSHSLNFGNVDHEVRQFSDTLSKECLETVVENASVKRHMASGIYGKRPVYIVTAIRVTMQSMTISKGDSTSRGGGVYASANAASGMAPFELGGDIHGNKEGSSADSYEAPPGIIFAYRVHVIRQKRQCLIDEGIFSSRAAFMSGGFGEDEMEPEAIDVSPEILNDDVEESAEIEKYELDGDDMCIMFR